MVTIVTDFAIASIIMLIAKLIRVKVPLIQKLYVPTPLLAGVIAIIGGQYGLNIIPFSEGVGSYAGALMTLLAASLALGTKEKTSFKSAMNQYGDQFLTNTVAYLSQWGVGLIVGIVLLPIIWKGINPFFGYMMPTGFAGGHGTAAGLGGIFEEAGFVDASSISMTFATIGMLIGVFGGMIMINIAARKGWTAVVDKPSELPQEFKTGLYTPQQMVSFGKQTICSMSMDTLSFHLMFVFIVALAAYKAADFIKATTTIGMPTMGLALVLSMLANWIINSVGAGNYVDKEVSGHIGGFLTDFLIFFGVATINLSLVSAMWQPILVMSIIGVLTVLFYTWMCKKYCDGYWFEKAMIIFGWATGATPTSILLIRTCDPENKTNVFQNWVVIWLFVSIIDVFNTSLCPHFTIQGYGIPVSLVLLGAAAVFYVILMMRKKKQPA